MLISQGFQVQPSPGFTKDCLKKKNYAVSSSWWKVDVRGERSDWVELMERQKHLRLQQAADHTSCHSCQRITGNWAYNLHELTQSGRYGKNVAWSESQFLLCHLNGRVREHREAWIHPGLCQQFRLVHVANSVVGDILHTLDPLISVNTHLNIPACLLCCCWPIWIHTMKNLWNGSNLA